MNGRHRAVDEQRVREAFIEGSPGEDLGLLLEATKVEAGQTIRIAPISLSKPIRYGVGANLLDRDSGKPVGPVTEVFDVALSARLGEAGRCVSLKIPRRIAPGEYEAKLGIGLRSPQPVTAPLRVVPSG